MERQRKIDYQMMCVRRDRDREEENGKSYKKKETVYLSVKVAEKESIRKKAGRRRIE